jgi:hypothetical protein
MDTQIGKLEEPRHELRKSMTIAMTMEARRVLRFGKLQFDMTHSDIVVSALMEWSKRHGLDKIIDRMPASSRLPAIPTDSLD